LNVEAERDDPQSMLSLCRRLIALRRAEPALAVSGFRSVRAQGDVLAYFRFAEERWFLVVLNLGAHPAALRLREGDPGGLVVLGTSLEREGSRIEGDVELAGNEAVVVRLDAEPPSRQG